MCKSLILAFESSCDDTSVALLDSVGTVLRHEHHSHDELSSDTRGIVPERQARAHLEHFSHALHTWQEEWPDIWKHLGIVCATLGPGLIGGLMVGTTFARAFAWSRERPFIGINHLAGHVLSPRFQSHSPQFPYLTLLLSGGHSQIVYVKGAHKFEVLGTTLDDALGEVFDKTAVLLGLGFPGGAKLEQLARDGNPKAFRLPTPMVGRDEPHFSFSGLKSAVRRVALAESQGYKVQTHQETQLLLSNLERRPQWVADLAASFQACSIRCVQDRLARALQVCQEKKLTPPHAVALVGGVARNLSLRDKIAQTAALYDLPLVLPPLWLCSDNAVMIGWAALEQGDGILHESSRFTDPIRASWPLDLRE